MTPYTLLISEQYIAALDDIADFLIAKAGDTARILNYIDRIDKQARKLVFTPHIGQHFPSVRLGLRMVPFEKSARIFFIVDDNARTVTLLHVTYQGQQLRLGGHTL